MTAEAELAALRIILGNVVAKIATAHPDGTREFLAHMADECKAKAEHLSSLGPDRAQLVSETRTYLDEFFKGITLG